MVPGKRGVLALALAIAASGCAPMPKIEAPERTTEALTGIGDPFQFKVEKEQTDIAERAGETLAFGDAVKRSLSHDPGLQAALARIRQAEAEAEQQRLWPNPILSLAVRFQASGGGRPDIETSLTADLLSLLLKPGRISAADGRLRKSTADALIVVLDVLTEVSKQYSKVQALTARVAIDEERRKILSELLKVTDARLRGGEAARLDVLTVQSEVARVETELLTRRSEERQARLTLARLIGEPSSQAVWKLEPWSAGGAASDDEDTWIKTALTRRPEIQSAVWELSALGQEMRVARFGSFIDGSAVGPDAERAEGSWAIGPGVVLPIPVFDVGQAQRSLIGARIIEQRHELTKTERQVIEEVRVALESLRSANAALLEVNNRVIPLQQDRLKQARNAYQAGLADILAVRLAEQELQQARSQQVDLEEQVSQSGFSLVRAAGGARLADSKNDQTNVEIKK